jgi:hypothetical protein
MATESAAPKPDLGAKAKKHFLMHFSKRILKGKWLSPKLRNLLANHHRNLDGAIPLPFTTPGCKRQKSYARSRRSKKR